MLMSNIITDERKLPIADFRALLEAREHDPFHVLGCHWFENGYLIRVFLPGAQFVTLSADPSSKKKPLPMTRVGNTDLFEWSGKHELPKHYCYTWTDHHGQHHRCIDPYSFDPQLDEGELYLFSAGWHERIYRLLGAHCHTVDDIEGCRFAVWAPNAERVSVVGDFNQWDGRRHQMVCRGASGVWELFLPEVGANSHYKFEIRNRDSGHVILKADPFAFKQEQRPNTASLVVAPSQHTWTDDTWIQQRRKAQWQHSPCSIYEVHLGSWQRNNDGGFLTYRELAERLIPHVKSLGFTHIELLPITEHPLDASWGYQTLGYFAPTSRFGSPDELRYFIDCCHRENIGVILDWVAGHFPKDEHGLAKFDGSELFEHSDHRRAEQPDWGTLNFNYGRFEVKNFLVSNALYWLEEFHFDGLRVDAVAAMLYLDYSRNDGEWDVNDYGGNENLEAIRFLRELNEKVHGLYPGAVVIAEESTAWPQVSRPTYVGGLGFSMKWNMGWMHDTLNYMSQDPVHRRYYHQKLTFGMLYHYHENFVLPLSHDEVVHGKGSFINKMPGDLWQQFANLRLLFTYMMTYPGKKLLFMGGEFAQRGEWDFNSALEWSLIQFPEHRGISQLIKDLNHLYRDNPALHVDDFSPSGFEWIDCHDSEQSVLSYLRRGNNQYAVVALNYTPVPRHNYRLGVPVSGCYQEALNSDSEYYCGSNVGNNGLVETQDIPWLNQPYSVQLNLPPLAGIVIIPEE